MGAGLKTTTGIIAAVLVASALAQASRVFAPLAAALFIIAIVGIFSGARQVRDSWPFAMTVVLFVAAFLSLAVMFWPYMIPYSVTVAAAAAPKPTTASVAAAAADHAGVGGGVVGHADRRPPDEIDDRLFRGLEVPAVEPPKGFSHKGFSHRLSFALGSGP